MVRKTLLGLVGCTLIALPAFAVDGPVGGTVSVGVVSSYMWNGFDRVKAFGLEEGPSVQPKASVGLRNTGLAVEVGGSFVVNDNSDLQETTYGVTFQKSVSPVVSVGAGYTYYDNRLNEVGGVPVVDVNNHEGWGSVELQSRVGVSPGVTVKYEKSSSEDVDPYVVAVGSLKYAMPLTGVNVGGAGVAVNWGAGVVYNSGITVGGVETVKSGVSAVTLGVNSALHVGGGVVVTPAVNYQVSVEDTVNPDNQFWAGLGLAYGF
jgi:hypothetical protein